MATNGLIDRLIIFNSCMIVLRGGNDNMGTPRKKTLEDFNAYGTFANTSQESIIVLDSCARSSDFMKDVGVDTSQIATVFPGCSNSTLQMKQRDFVS